MTIERAMDNGTKTYMETPLANGSSYGKGDRYTAAPNEWVDTNLEITTENLESLQHDRTRNQQIVF